MRRQYDRYYNIILMNNRSKPEDIFILKSGSLRNISKQLEGHWYISVCSGRPVEVTFQKTEKWRGF